MILVLAFLVCVYLHNICGRKMTRGFVYGVAGTVVQPSEALHKAKDLYARCDYLQVGSQ